MWHIQSFVFSPIQENTYLLYNDHKQCIIVDPGCYFKEEQDQLKQFIINNELKPQMLLNTHCHLDHVFGNQYVYDTWQLIPHIHKNEEIVLQFASKAGEMYNLPFKNYSGPLNFLKERDKLNLNGNFLEVLFAPGHSPGHICFYCEKQNFIISGDVLFKQSIGRTDLPGGNYETLIKSIQTQLLTLPDETIVYSGHGSITTIGEEKTFNPFLVN